MRRAALRIGSIVLIGFIGCTEKPAGPPPPPPSRFTEVTHLDAAVTELRGYALRDGVVAFAKKSGEGKDAKVDVMVDGVNVRTNLRELPDAVTGRRGAVFVVANQQTRLVPPGFVWQSLAGVGEISKDHWIGYEPREKRWDADEVGISLQGKGKPPQPPEKYEVRDAALNGDGQMCAVLRKYVDGKESSPPSWSGWWVEKDGKEQVVELADNDEEAPRATRAGGECVIVSLAATSGLRHAVIRRFTPQGLVRLHELPFPERFRYALSQEGHLWYLGTAAVHPETPELHRVALTLESAPPRDEVWPLPAAVPDCANAHPHAIIPATGEAVWLELACDAPKHRALLHAPASRR